VKLLLVSLFLSCGAAVAAEDWPRFRGPTGEGVWDPPQLPTDLAKIEPRRRWAQPVGAGFSGVTVSGRRVYLMDRQKTPEEVERVVCLDEQSGRQLWVHEYPASYGKMDYGSGPRASVTIDGGRAYAFGATGMFHCLDAATGQVQWKRDVRELGAKAPQWGFAASPYLWKETVLVHCGAQPRGSVVAFDRATGAERWRGGSDPAGYCTPAVFETAGGPQLIQWGPKHIESLDPETGRELWRFPYDVTYGVSIAQPLFRENVLLVAGYWHGTRALRLGPSAGEPQLAWSDEKKLCGLMSTPLYREGHVYLLTKDEGVVCFKLADGSIRWSDGHCLTPDERNPQVSLVWASQKEGIVCGLNARGELVFARFRPEGMEELGRHQIIGKTWAHPAFTRNAVFARTDTEAVCWELWP
jgi:outer membrane protein assembly factor BamB